ncbi:MAG: acyl-CoA dehydrogenase family protein [Steroidobacteraceae bacterium]
MDFRPEPAEAAFRAEVTEFLARSLPQHLRMQADGAQLSTRQQTLSWQRTLFERGWAAPHWPMQHGGTGWTPAQRLIFDVETALAGAPATNHQGMSMLGPIVNMFGTAEQRERLIPPLLRGDTYWCQGFSEPAAGSDLASLQTSGRREGDRFIVNGQKVWTSHAGHADWIFLLVRTEKTQKKQAGISFLVSPIDVPGIAVRQIRSIDGLEHLTEVFLQDVEIHRDNLIGEPGEGWAIAKRLLGRERISGACDLPGMLRELQRLKSLLVHPPINGRAPIDEPIAACRLARLDMEAKVMTMNYLRASLADRFENLNDAGVVSMLKVQVTELHRRIVEFMYDALGPRGPLFYPRPMEPAVMPRIEGFHADLGKVSSELMYRRAGSIYGGTNEIQRELIARSVLAG